MNTNIPLSPMDISQIDSAMRNAIPHPQPIAASSTVSSIPSQIMNRIRSQASTSDNDTSDTFDARPILPPLSIPENKDNIASTSLIPMSVPHPVNTSWQVQICPRIYRPFGTTLRSDPESKVNLINSRLTDNLSSILSDQAEAEVIELDFIPPQGRLYLWLCAQPDNHKFIMKDRTHPLTTQELKIICRTLLYANKSEPTLQQLFEEAQVRCLGNSPPQIISVNWWIFQSSAVFAFKCLTDETMSIEFPGESIPHQPITSSSSSAFSDNAASITAPPKPIDCHITVEDYKQYETDHRALGNIEKWSPQEILDITMRLLEDGYKNFFAIMDRICTYTPEIFKDKWHEDPVKLNLFAHLWNHTRPKNRIPKNEQVCSQVLDPTIDEDKNSEDNLPPSLFSSQVTIKMRTCLKEFARTLITSGACNFESKDTAVIQFLEMLSKLPEFTHESSRGLFVLSTQLEKEHFSPERRQKIVVFHIPGWTAPVYVSRFFNCLSPEDQTRELTMEQILSKYLPKEQADITSQEYREYQKSSHHEREDLLKLAWLIPTLRPKIQHLFRLCLEEHLPRYNTPGSEYDAREDLLVFNKIEDLKCTLDSSNSSRSKITNSNILKFLSSPLLPLTEVYLKLQLGDDNIEILNAALSSKSVRSIHIEGIPNSTQEAKAETPRIDRLNIIQCSPSPKLETVVLKNYHLTDLALAHLAALAPNLHTLILDLPEIPAHLQFISHSWRHFSRWNRLRTLQIFNAPDKMNDNFREVNKLKKLEHFAYTKKDPRNAALAINAPLELPQLRSLKINGIDNRGLNLLLSDPLINCANLGELALNGSRITDFRPIAALPLLDTLSYDLEEDMLQPSQLFLDLPRLKCLNFAQDGQQTQLTSENLLSYYMDFRQRDVQACLDAIDRLAQKAPNLIDFTLEVADGDERIALACIEKFRCLKRLTVKAQTPRAAPPVPPPPVRTELTKIHLENFFLLTSTWSALSTFAPNLQILTCTRSFLPYTPTDLYHPDVHNPVNGEAHSPAALNLPKLWYLQINGIDDRGVEILLSGSLPILRELKLNGARITNLAPIRHLNKLESLSCNFCPLPSTAFTPHCLPDALRTVDFSNIYSPLPRDASGQAEVSTYVVTNLHHPACISVLSELPNLNQIICHGDNIKVDNSNVKPTHKLLSSIPALTNIICKTRNAQVSSQSILLAAEFLSQSFFEIDALMNKINESAIKMKDHFPFAYLSSPNISTVKILGHQEIAIESTLLKKIFEHKIFQNSKSSTFKCILREFLLSLADGSEALSKNPEWKSFLFFCHQLLIKLKPEEENILLKDLIAAQLASLSAPPSSVLPVRERQVATQPMPSNGRLQSKRIYHPQAEYVFTGDFFYTSVGELQRKINSIHPDICRFRYNNARIRVVDLQAFFGESNFQANFERFADRPFYEALRVIMPDMLPHRLTDEDFQAIFGKFAKQPFYKALQEMHSHELTADRQRIRWKSFLRFCLKSTTDIPALHRSIRDLLKKYKTFMPETPPRVGNKSVSWATTALIPNAFSSSRDYPQPSLSVIGSSGRETKMPRDLTETKRS